MRNILHYLLNKSLIQYVYFKIISAKRLLSKNKIYSLINNYRHYDEKSIKELYKYANKRLVETKSYFNLSKYDIGKYTYGNPTVSWADYGNAKLKIGKFCSIAPDVKIFLAGEHRTDSISTYPFDYMFVDGKYLKKFRGDKGDVIIRNDVWIGEGVLIMSGVKIGDGAIIAAHAVVVNDVAPYAIVGGVPAKVIRMRFNEEIVKALLRISWWDWPIDIINRELKSLCDADINNFILRYDK